MSERRTWVLHRGSLGDSVLLWPMLRHLRRMEEHVSLVTDDSKARLAERWVDVEPVSAEQDWFTSLWRDEGPRERFQGVGAVHAWLGASGLDRVRAHLSAAFPEAEVHVHAGRPDRRFAVEFTTPPMQGMVERRWNRDGPLVVHAGAGSREKRWPIERFRAVADAMRGEGVECRLIAGEVEHEQWRGREHDAFIAGGGRFIGTLDELGDVLHGARLFVGCDTGPSHLAAQMGIRTLSLFGPTDPEAWAPVGPAATVIQSPTGRMEDIAEDEVIGHLHQALVDA